MSRLRSVADSLAAEAAGMTRKMPGVQVVIVVTNGEDRQLRATVEPDEKAPNWDHVSSVLRAVAEEVRTQQRSPK